ncbi:glycosyltransferase [Pleurocapsa sp. FMAR1]|uniref:glycosyltransferase n=1 Tax=Pleurocapsa sp. FMAR1 TaxID=3040204 RepID=UPI0029C8730D|nr:glycosyltransferase [Pleurocapsa sp. FMAR1]
MNPKVTVCLPNLNNFAFIRERLDTIVNQTFQDWELVVVDGYSNDGAWEIIQEYASQDSRIHLFQEQPEGIYQAFNSCIYKARGEYIYIATSDDTMTPDCLEKMVATLDKNTDCDLCQCKLEFIDENSELLPAEKQWSVHTSTYLKQWLDCPHKRYAPHDGILHFAVLTVYTSLTQLLIRKQLFERIGYFKAGWGSMADFEWGMRASLLYNTVYIPEVLATWRKHSSQATTDPYTPQNLKILLKMAHHALDFARQHNLEKVKNISYRELSHHYKMSIINIGLNQQNSFISKLCYLFICAIKLPLNTLVYSLNKLFLKQLQPQTSALWINNKITRAKIAKPLKIS